MIEQFESIILALMQPKKSEGAFSLFDPAAQFDTECTDQGGMAQALNAAFLITLSGPRHLEFEQAKRFLTRLADSPDWKDAARFYLNGINLIHAELSTLCQQDPDFSNRLKDLSAWLAEKRKKNLSEAAEKIWSVFFPEATGIQANKEECVEALRKKRTVTITELNPNPISDPAQEILFTSNVLLTLPPASKSQDELRLTDPLKKELLKVAREPQLFWYDHPIQIGVEPEKNEVLHGLRGLSQTMAFERGHGTASPHDRLTCVLSVSVTHRGLRGIANKYLEEEFAHSNSLRNMDVYVFTEADTQRMVKEVLAPAARFYLKSDEADDLLSVLGVDGEYGRHYSFLKAIAAFWSVFIQPKIRATFKIDLDQSFPQEKLITQTGASAFEHFKTSLWGAYGLDRRGQPLELGMIAGFLVNAQDIGKSLFFPDVLFPERALSPDEYIFFSTLPQAYSTEAEMMTRYNTNKLDGKKTCIQRVHVTGGTNGILISSLRCHRPFTPSFFGRAEDQAYILSVFPKENTRLTYVHKDGLVMSHNKEAFAQEAIQSAHLGKLVGDYVRILYFSAYAHTLTNDVSKLKEAINPFTGCFVSRLPTTVVYLRFGLKAASFFNTGQKKEGLEFISVGARRIMEALDFIRGQNSLLKQTYEKERLGWNLYYDTLSAIEDAFEHNDEFSLELQKKAKNIVNQCYVRLGSK
ncbi:MAG: hypothetical protein JRI95_07535 [Deltaproteobacteria bacterium]|nr:hypothetical protein [Deltaproteobacteria bacterium]